MADEEKSEVPEDLKKAIAEREAEANNYAFPPCAGCGSSKR